MHSESTTLLLIAESKKNVPYDKHLSMYTMCSFAKAFSSKIIFVRLRIPQPLSQTQV